MKTIGIKLADGSFYPVLEDNTPSEKQLELTTAHNNQTKVMVDLYRSATCSMDDAEYVDSLQIENLTARPNGETDIKFSISLDEDNQLSAKIVDPETGNESNTTITLVSRTLEERLITDDYAINDSKEKSSGGTGAALAGAVAAGGLLAAATAMRNKAKDEDVEKDDDLTIAEETTIEDTIEETEIPVEETAVDEPLEEAAAENSELPDMDFDLPEENPETTSEEVKAEEGSDETIAEDAAPEISADENISENLEDNLFTEEESAMPDMDFDLPDEEAGDETIASTDTISEEESVLPDMDFDLPEENQETTSEEVSEASTEEDAELPDMDFDLPDDSATDVDDENPVMPDDFFNTDDLDNSVSVDNSVTDEEEESMRNSSFDSDSPAAGGLNFDGLYDEETERGTSAETEADEVKKKTKVPVIICIICAIICIIATLLILFIIPSKYNLITKKHAKEAAETVAIEEPAPEPSPAPVAEPEPAVPEAKEDEIVIIEKAEEVVPKQPPVAEEKPKNITYKIKWGDTLWDIADTYYKNPWRYKYIARYNGIKNPDYIISGTKIIIPAE